MTEIILAPWPDTSATLQKWMFTWLIIKKLEEYFAQSNTTNEESTMDKLQSMSN